MVRWASKRFRAKIISSVNSCTHTLCISTETGLIRELKRVNQADQASLLVDNSASNGYRKLSTHVSNFDTLLKERLCQIYQVSDTLM